MIRPLFISLLIITLSAFGLSAPAHAEIQEFQNPSHQNFRLDYCRHWDQQCGQEAANLFCEENGFRRARRWVIENDVGPTMVLGDGRVCRDAGCDGFSSITCARPGRGEREGRTNARRERQDQQDQADADADASAEIGNTGQAPTYTFERVQTPPPSLPPHNPGPQYTVPEPGPGIILPFAGITLLPTIENCVRNAPRPGDYVCTTIAAYHTCQGHLRDGTVSDCVAEVSSPGSLIQFQQPHPSSYSVSTTSNARATVYQNDRSAGSFSGRSDWRVSFTAPDEYANPGCNANAPIVGPGECMRRCETKNRYTYHLDDAAGGIFAIAGLDSCNSLISSGRAPDEYDLYRAWDICQAQDAWGGNANGTIRFRIAALYHMSDPHTSHNGNTWSYENEADVIAPYADVTANLTISCVGS